MSLTLEQVIDTYAHTKVGNFVRVKWDKIEMTKSTNRMISMINY